MSTSKLLLPNKHKIFDRDTVVFELEWPVYIIECIAYKMQEKHLNILEMGILRLLAVKKMSKSMLSKLLDVGEEVINTILNELNVNGWIDDSYQLTSEALRLLKDEYNFDEEGDGFTKQQIFGQMFISRVDDFVMPYFYEGGLPPIRIEDSESDAVILRYQDNKTINKKGLNARLNKAYIEYVKAYNQRLRLQKNEQDKSIKFVSREIYSPELEAIFDNSSTITNFNESKEIERIRALDTQIKMANLIFKICISKASPKKFTIVPPFSLDETPIYSRVFKQMKNDKEINVKFNNEIISLGEWCSNITESFYKEFPELKKTLDNDDYIRLTYPGLPMVDGRYRENIKNALLDVVNHIRLFENNKIPANTLVMSMGRSIELMLNCLVAETDINNTVYRYKNKVKTENDLQLIFYKQFDILSCKAMNKEKMFMNGSGRYGKYKGIMNNFYSRPNKYRNGDSIPEKYFYLVIDAHFNDSKMRRILQKEGAGFIDRLDAFIDARNRYGAHQRGISLENASASEIKNVMTNFDQISKLIVSEL